MDIQGYWDEDENQIEIDVDIADDADMDVMYELIGELNDVAQHKDFGVFNNAELVVGIAVPGANTYTRKEIDNLIDWIKRPQVGALGMVYVRCNEDGTYKSSVDKFYTEEDLAKHYLDDPKPKLRKKLIELGVTENDLLQIENETAQNVATDFSNAVVAPEPIASTVSDYVFVPTTVTEEKGERSPINNEKVLVKWLENDGEDAVYLVTK